MVYTENRHELVKVISGLSVPGHQVVGVKAALRPRTISEIINFANPEKRVHTSEDGSKLYL